MQLSTYPDDIATLPAEEALWLGAAFAHIALYNERNRLARIERQNRMMVRRHLERGR